MAKMETRLSLASLNELIKRLETKKDRVPQIATNIANRLADEMLEEVKGVKAYGDTYKIPATLEGEKATAGIKNDTAKAYFNEYGTGVVGSENPHVNEELTKIGWQYDRNGHGEAGWWYPTTESDPNPYKWTDNDGNLRAWTKGLTSKKVFYNALKTAEERFTEVGKEELERED